MVIFVSFPFKQICIDCVLIFFKCCLKSQIWIRCIFAMFQFNLFEFSPLKAHFLCSKIYCIFCNDSRIDSLVFSYNNVKWVFINFILSLYKVNYHPNLITMRNHICGSYCPWNYNHINKIIYFFKVKLWFENHPVT